MNIGKACAIFEQIESDKYTEQDKLQAIKEVIAMPTHNGITKDEILKAFRWLFNQVMVEENEKQTNADRIRAMNDKELEKFLSMCVSDCQGRKLEKREFCKGCPFDTGVGYCTDKRIKKWLQSESE